MRTFRPTFWSYSVPVCVSSDMRFLLTLLCFTLDLLSCLYVRAHTRPLSQQSSRWPVPYRYNEPLWLGMGSQLNHNHVTFHFHINVATLQIGLHILETCWWYSDSISCIRETKLKYLRKLLYGFFNVCITCNFVKGGLMKGQMWIRTAKPCTHFALMVIEMDEYPTWGTLIAFQYIDCKHQYGSSSMEI